MNAAAPPAQRYCIRTADGERICEIVQGPTYNPYSTFAVYVVRAVEGKPLNPINRMVIPEWKLGNKVPS